MLIIRKYGGTSVGSLERIKAVALRVIESVKAGSELAVVISAINGVTNSLTERVEYFNKNPSGVDMDMFLNSGERVTSALLFMALNELGYKAVSFSGRKADIITNSVFTKTRTKCTDTSAIKTALKEGEVVIVAGFQGVDERGNVTTLGRGGSDLSAVTVAGTLDADLCEIYTSVDGVHTTDPRIELKAKELGKVSYKEMLELASLGTKVLQSCSVELAKELSVNLVTRNNFNNNEGIVITKKDGMEQVLVSGIALDKNQTRVTLRNIEGKPGIVAEVFSDLVRVNINVDVIIQNVDTNGATNLSFTVPGNGLNQVKSTVKEALGDQVSLEGDSAVVKVSVVSVGTGSRSGVASTAFEALAGEGIDIGMISTDEIKISMIMHERYGELAVHASHEIYRLDE